MAVVSNFYIPLFAQHHPSRSLVPVKQLDPRFNFSAEKYWSGLSDSEAFYFYVQNNTSQEYKIVIEVNLDLNCAGNKTFKLGFNKYVYLKPNGTFSPSEDWVHDYMITFDREKQKACLIQEGNHKTLLNSLTWTLSGIENLTEKKAETEQAKQQRTQGQQPTANNAPPKISTATNKVAPAPPMQSAPVNNGQVTGKANIEEYSNGVVPNHARRLLLTKDRKTMISKYQEGKTPLGSLAQNTVYFFAYSYSDSALGNENPDLKLSNVFKIAKRSDGSWPQKYLLLIDLAKKNQNEQFTLAGYYATEAEASAVHQKFIADVFKYNFSIRRVDYTQSF